MSLLVKHLSCISRDDLRSIVCSGDAQVDAQVDAVRVAFIKQKATFKATRCPLNMHSPDILIYIYISHKISTRKGVSYLLKIVVFKVCFVKNDQVCKLV